VTVRVSALLAASSLVLVAACSAVTPVASTEHTGARARTDASPQAGRARTGMTRSATAPTAANRSVAAHAQAGQHARIALAGLQPRRDFNVHYDFSGAVTLERWGLRREFSGPEVGQSSWQDGQATVFVRGSTAYGTVGFLLGFSDDTARSVARVLMVVPASRDTAHPGETFFDFPLEHWLDWLDAAPGTALSSRTIDGVWVASVLWTDDATVTFELTPGAGQHPPESFHAGRLQLHFDDSQHPWSAWHLDFEVTSGRGSAHGGLVASA
jgi:hypothetical protein